MEYLFNSKSFGVVIYMSDERYSVNIEENSKIHCVDSKRDIYLGFITKLYKLGLSDNNIVNVVIAHEHGDMYNKCHMQIYIEFLDKVRKVLLPGNFKLNDITYLYITQHAKYPKRLREYCKKSNDYDEYFPDKSIKEILRNLEILDELMDNDDPYGVLLKRTDLDEEGIKTLFSNCCKPEFKKSFVVNAKKVFENYSLFIKKDENKLDFKWQFPGHIYDYCINHNSDDDKKLKIYCMLYNWYNDYCTIDQSSIRRRKALFLFSFKGGLGKSCFARGLVPELSLCESPYYVYCRGTLDASEFLRKKKTARLVILDDINYIEKDIEIWKALAVSEPTNIRSPYYNIQWNKSLPCILLSNNIKTFNYWYSAIDLRNRCVFVSIDFYIGPPGTENRFTSKMDFELTDDVKDAIEKLNNNDN